MFKPTSPRTDVLDAMVTLWLSGAVAVAAVAAAPFDAYRTPAPAPVGSAPPPATDAACECEACQGPEPAHIPSEVGRIRPEDARASYAPEPGMSETCRDCRFYAGVSSEVGECRRFAPAFGETAVGEWPLTRAKQWCGEHIAALVPTH